MATYYKWRKSTISYGLTKLDTFHSDDFKVSNTGISINYSSSIEYSENEIELVSPNNARLNVGDDLQLRNNTYFMITVISGSKVYRADDNIRLYFSGSALEVINGTFSLYEMKTSPGTSQGYVYSTSSSAYPNGGVQDGYYYDQQTTVTSPTIPGDVTVSSPITSPTFTVSWTAATSNTNYPVKQYLVQVKMNAAPYPILAQETVAGTSIEITIPTTYNGAPVTSVNVTVLAQDTNNQNGPGSQISSIPVRLAPTLTVPPMVMQGQPATISWTAIEGADSYTLQRKSSADTDWTQVYSGADTTYTETVGTWTSLQYRVQAVFDGTGGGWAASDPIQIVSASALVISGQDGDLGTLTSDVSYSISSDQTSPTITATVEVNGGEYASFQATSGETYSVGVLDLPTGTGSIVITATTEVSSSPVTVTRTWTYSKTAQAFPNSGSVATLTKEGNVVYPETLTEAVRASMTPWGGNLSTALELLKRAALFNRTKQPKYSEVTISMANVTEGQIVQLPEGGVMTPFYVSKIGYESELNDPGRILLVRAYSQFDMKWNNTDVDAYATCSMDTWFNGTYKNLFPSEIQEAMGTTKFYYTPGNGDYTVTTIERSVFALSLTELGFSSDEANVEGSALPIASILNQLKDGGSTRTQWTRSPAINDLPGMHVWRVYSAGNYSTIAPTAPQHYARPCFTFPSTFSGTYLVDEFGNIGSEQEYTEAGDWLDVWGNAIPAVKIETGSYVGTGTYGSSNPTTLTVSFEPKVVFVVSYNQASASSRYFTSPLIRNVRSANSINGTPSSSMLVISWTDNTVSWYGTDANNQLNASGQNYNYVALG